MSGLLKERRTGNDRRSWEPMQKGTRLIDSDGNLVIKDRRRQPERRLSNIQVRAGCTAVRPGNYKAP